MRPAKLSVQTDHTTGGFEMRSKLNTMASAAAAVVGAAALARYLVRNSRCVDIAGKVVLITGGSRGLGLVLAREFASRGSRVAICARHERELEHVREEFSEQGKHVLAVTCDVGVRAEVGRMVQTVREQLGPIGILVNNAGAIVWGPRKTKIWKPSKTPCRQISGGRSMRSLPSSTK